MITVWRAAQCMNEYTEGGTQQLLLEESILLLYFFLTVSVDVMSLYVLSPHVTS